MKSTAQTVMCVALLRATMLFVGACESGALESGEDTVDVLGPADADPDGRDGHRGCAAGVS